MEIAFVGDVMLGRLVADELRRRPPAHPWGDTLPLLQRADLLVGNLECVIAGDGRPWPGKRFHFRAGPEALSSLESAGFGLVSVANNHLLDYGTAAALESLAALARRGIRSAGAGADLAAASSAAEVSRAGIRIGMVAFTDNEPDWAAGPGTPGVHHVPVDLGDRRAAALLERVRRARDRVDLLIVSAHWGGNWGDSVPRSHRRFAAALVDAGASVVFGHSPHVARGVEIAGGAPVLYSAGDFVDDYAVDPIERNDRSFVFVLRTEGPVPVELRLHPTRISRFRARLAGRESREIAEHMARRCAELGTSAAWHEGLGCLVIPVRGSADRGAG